MNDDERRMAAVSVRNARLADDLLKHTHLLTVQPVEKVGALLTAAFVLIEREVGREMAAAYLQGMVEPQLADWQGMTLHDTMQ